jgi:uncharacterized membrane protein YoaK (UPF0700 family)
MAENKNNQLKEENLPEAGSLKQKNKNLMLLMVVIICFLLGKILGGPIGDIASLASIVCSVILIVIMVKNRAK